MCSDPTTIAVSGTRRSPQKDKDAARHPGGTLALFHAGLSRLLRTSFLWWMAAFVAVIPASLETMGMGAGGAWDAVTGAYAAVLYAVMGIVPAAFTAQDFTSGFSKNLFTTRPDRTAYARATTLTGWTAGLVLVAAYALGALAAGIVNGLDLAAGLATLPAALVTQAAMMLLLSSAFTFIDVMCTSHMWLSIALTCTAAALLSPMALASAMMPAYVAAGMSVAAAAIGAPIIARAAGTALNHIDVA